MHTKSLMIVTGLAVALLTGCTTPKNRAIIGSFEDITSSRHTEDGLFAQIHAASVNGLLPFDAVGETYFYDDKRGVLSAVGLSSVNTNGISAPRSSFSYKVIREYPTDATLEDLKAVRDGISSSAAWSIRALRAEIAYRQAATNGSALVSQLHADWTNAAANAEAAFNALSRATSKRNLILFRWNTQGERSASAKAGSFFGGKASRGSSQTGYGLVAGFRTSTLFVGADIIMQLSHDVSAVRNTVKKGMVVPTFSIAASNLLYFAQSDLASEIQAKLQGSYSQFSNLGATLKGLDEIELAYVAQRLESLSNTGVVQGPSQITATRFSTYRTLEKLVDEVKASEGWTTFYAILTRAEEVVRVYAPPPAATRSK